MAKRFASVRGCCSCRLKAAAGAGKRKKAAVSGKPKRPPSAFFVFMSEFRQEYQAPRSTLTIRVSKAAGEKWRSMSEEEKASYVDQAGQKKQDYEKSKATFDKKESTRSKKAKIDEDDGEGSDKSKSDVNDDDEDGVSDEDSSKLRKREIDTGTGEAYERSPW